MLTNTKQDLPIVTIDPGYSIRVVPNTSGGLDIYTDAIPAPNSFTFAWLTDIHNGRYSYEPNHPKLDIDHVLSLNPDFVIVTGDCSENGTLEQLQGYYNLWTDALPMVYHLSGNHDEIGDYNAPPPNDYTNYENTVICFRWAFTHNGVRFIGFKTDLERGVTYNGFAYVSDEDRAFVEANLASDMPNFLFTHFPFSDTLGQNVKDWWNQDGGQQWLNDLAQSHNIRLFTGHRHLDGLNKRISNQSPMIEVNGGCFAYDNDNGNGSFQLVTVTNGSQVVINRYLAREPYNLLQTMAM